MTVDYHDNVDQSMLRTTVIVARYKGNLAFCARRNMSSYEIPHGHRGAGEDIESAARRILYEKIGAKDFDLKPISAYSVLDDNGIKAFGMLYFADVKEMDMSAPRSDIERVLYLAQPPTDAKRWSYPEIHPTLLLKVLSEIRES